MASQLGSLSQFTSEAGPSRSHSSSDDLESQHDPQEELNGESPDENGLGEGMVLEGFAGPSDRIVKPLTVEALSAFKDAQEKTGVIYISRIPPGMRPTKVRHIMSAYGEVGRVYLQQEGAQGASLYSTDTHVGDLIYDRP